MKLKNNLIKKRRVEMGLSPKQAAELSGLSYPLWLRYEGLKNNILSGKRMIG
jgi:predicted transcriptional regulator